MTALLRAANPMPLQQLPPMAELPEALDALERIVAVPPRRTLADRRVWPERQPRRPRLVAVIAALVTLSAGAAAYAIVTRNVTKSLYVNCYASGDLVSHRTVVSSDGRDPVTLCAEAWRSGRLGPVQTPPPLTACVLDSGVAGVFPSDPAGSVCARLGLSDLVVPTTVTTAPAPAPTPVPVAGTVAQLRDRLTGESLSQSCLSPDDAAALARSEIARLGLAGWTVVASVPGPFPADRPCGSFGFDEEQRRVLIIPATPHR